MSIQAMNWAREVRTGSPVLKAVLLAVANYADADGSCWPSQERIAHDTELGERTVRRSLAELEAMGLLRREERRSDRTKSFKSDRIILTEPPATQAAGPAATQAKTHR